MKYSEAKQIVKTARSYGLEKILGNGIWVYKRSVIAIEKEIGYQLLFTSSQLTSKDNVNEFIEYYIEKANDELAVQTELNGGMTGWSGNTQ